MLKTFLLLLFSLSIQNSFSQFYIKGRVTDTETQAPLKGASVYINNTTKGSITDENGEFSLGPFIPGRYEVVASYVGYSALLYSAEISNNGVRISFKLNKKEQTMREVLVLSDETRRRYLEIFKQYVLGTSIAAEHCRVKNLDEIQFASGETKDEIVAYTENELVIENPEFGYTIHFDLLNFYYNRKTSGSYFYGYSRFVDWGKDEQTKKKWIRKRKQAYDGSTVHFFRSLLNRNLESEGFTVYQLIDNQKVKKDTLNLTQALSQENKPGMKMARRAIEDSMVYLYSDSIFRIYQLRISDGWRIIYAKSTSLKTEMMRKNFLSGQPPTGTITGLRLREDPVLINEKGILLTPIRVFYDGIWAFERLANMLPEDYELD
jgi:hypothetical protein